MNNNTSTGFFGSLMGGIAKAFGAAAVPSTPVATTPARENLDEVTYLTRYPQDMPLVNKEIARVRSVLRNYSLSSEESKSITNYLRGLETFAREWGNRSLTAKHTLRTSARHTVAVFEVYTPVNKLIHHYEYRMED